jgi:hypothetical protein
MVFVQVAPATSEKTAIGRPVNTTSTPRGAIAWAAALTGLLPSELPSNSKTTGCGRERHCLPIDGSRGRRVTKRLHPTNTAFYKIMQSLSSNYYACLSLLLFQVKEHKPDNSPVIPHPTLPLENANKITQQ